MRWKKLGRIFDPRNYWFASHRYEFAQAPCTLVSDNSVRIYFSTRRKDEEDKWRSYVYFIGVESNLLDSSV